MLIEVNNLDGSKIKKAFLKKVLETTAQTLKLPKDLELSVGLVSSQEIKRLNKKYRRKNKVTTILSFPYLIKKKGNGSLKKGLFLGELVLCYPEISKSAKEKGVLVSKELTNLLVHGFLHLIGFHHQTKKEEKKREEIESEILEKLEKSKIKK